MELKEYIVTAKSKLVLDELYDDIESEGGSLYIPHRKVEIKDERPMSRNTHYMLTFNEAQLLKNDERVENVELKPSELNFKVKPFYIQTSTYWNKSNFINNQFKNWAIPRVINGEQTTNWGIDGTQNKSTTIINNLSGKNVDIIICDGMIDPSHPEFALNSDGTGGSRVIQYNWLQHNPDVSSTEIGNYIYQPYSDELDIDMTNDNNHGCHVAGTAAGNTNGWARSANIYNINPYSTDVNQVDILYIFDYIRAFHKNKPVNPITKRKNPTIVNNSWGFSAAIPIQDIQSITFRGNVINGPFTESELISYGLHIQDNMAEIPIRYSALEADIQDAIEDGIIIVGAAGNSSVKMDIENGQDYNNKVTSGYDYFYHRGSSPGSTSNCITVGSINISKIEKKSVFSNCGPRVDIYAPGEYIISSFNSLDNGVSDVRDENKFLSKISGTSMASPQVTGVIACLLEIYNCSQLSIRNYILEISKQNQITDTLGSFTDFTSLQGSSNRFLFLPIERQMIGNVYPKVNFLNRNRSTLKYPRLSIRR